MCGGAGTRLWPASRENRPKQFLPLFGSLSTFQETVRRVSHPALFDRPIIVTKGQYRFLVAEQLTAIGAEADILLEPVRRDSGPAIVAGATYALRRGGDPLVAALAADLVISDPGAFAKICSMAGEAAQEDQIVMFGVHPTRPATEYGYIRPGPSIRPGLFAIERFVEKPDAETAARYVENWWPRMDSEDLREVIVAYQECVAETVRRFGVRFYRCVQSCDMVRKAASILRAKARPSHKGDDAKCGRNECRNSLR
jgi:mannose-1-phosphate guanylyltransferase / mannose-6-phosphate isomerase